MKNKRQGEFKTKLTSQAGVSLLEVMLLVFLLGGALLAGFTALRANISANSAESQTNILANVDRVLTGFIATYNRLPCPDVDGDGVEDCGSLAQKGRLPYRTIGLGSAEGMAGKGSLGYLVQRSSVDLTTAIDTWQPIKFKNNTELYTDTYRFNPVNIGTPDVCAKLIVGGQTALTAAQAQVTGASPRALAYALVHPGNRDEDNDGSVFDAGNISAKPNSMEPAERGFQAGIYDDRVLERSFGSLAQGLNCAGLTTSLNLLSLSAESVERVNAQKVTNIAAASLLTAYNAYKLLDTAKDVLVNGAQLATAVGYLTTSAGLLTAAIAGCAVIVGCFEIPHAVASVAVSVASIAASAVSVASSAVAVGFFAVAGGLTLSAAIMAGVSTTANLDLSAAITQSTNIANDATAKKNDAYAVWQKAISTESSLLSQKDTALNAAYAAGRDIVINTNAAGDPVGVLSETALDPWVTTVVNRANQWAMAESNYLSAAETYQNALKSTSGGSAGVNPNLTSALTAIQNAIDAETDPAKQQALISAKASIESGATSNASNDQQAAQLVLQIDALDAQIATSPSNVSDLITTRDQLRAQLSTMNMSVQSALDYKNAMDSTRATAYNPNYVGAITNAINNSRLPYSVKTCTTSGSPAVKSCTTKDYTYDGTVAMSNALTNLLGSSNQGVYFQWDLKQRQTLVAKDLYDAAVASETQAIGARDKLIALKTGVAGSGVSQPIWNGAVPILQQADNKGGIR